MTILLQKLSTVTEVTPGVAAVPAVAAVDFFMYACPLPLGYTYRQYQATPSGPYLPNSLATFLNWSQLIQAPTEYRSEIAGYSFIAIEDIDSGTPIGSSWIPQYTTVEGSTVLTGYLVPNIIAVALPPQYYGPIQHMAFIQFEGDLASNGYPLGTGDFTGTYQVPTTGGLLTVTNVYRKDSRGVLLPVSGDPVPPNCVRTGTCKVTALHDFPGRDAVPAVPAVTSTDYHIGWNAGANSLDTVTDDARVTFTPQVAAAVAVGFANVPREDVTTPNNLSHAFLIARQPNGRIRSCCLEFGQRVSQLIPYAPEDEFVIEREDGVVTYKINGDTVLVSTARSSGPIQVGTSLYAAGDGVL